MSIEIKNKGQIEYMRRAGCVVAKTHELLESAIRPGVTTGELDKIADEFIRSQGGIPSFKNYRGYPAAICASVNEEVIHGIPGLRKLRDGDIISIDIGAYINGYHGDAARTHGVGSISTELKSLIDVTKQSFFEGMCFARPGHHLHEISSSIQKYVESYGFSVVRDYVGHGIGKKLHEEPAIPNYKPPSRGPRLAKGMALAVEPMVNMGTYEIVNLEDHWTVVTKDGKYSAHYENTIIITDGEPELLTIY